jgi:D-glycero-D-manno-heptose 1,7-bisphosphate phosphatase
MRIPKRRAVFFDRDGTLNEEVGYLNELANFRVYPFAAPAIREINEAGLLALVVTNQSGVGRGMLTEQLVADAHVRLLQAVEAAGARIDDIYYCPHHPEAEVEQYRLDCDCRKPFPGMMRRAAQKFDLELEHSFVVGDRYVDIQMAHCVGAASILVLTGQGREEYERFRQEWPRQPDHVAENVYAAVRWILRALHPGGHPLS